MMQPSLESFCPSGRNHYHHSKLMAVFNTVLVWGRTVGITYQAPDSVSVWQTQTRQDTLYSVKHRLVLCIICIGKDMTFGRLGTAKEDISSRGKGRQCIYRYR